MSEIRSLYVHIPFCNEICSYCDFVKVYKDENIVYKYLECLKRELDKLNIGCLKTIYIGGGTPSCLDEGQLDFLLNMLSNIKLDNDYEYTIEANPESLSENKIKILKKYGVNRVSLGVQTFDEKLLKLLNRKHSLDDVKSVCNNLDKYGINNYSFDFIYALPFQTIDMINKDLDIAFSLSPKHLSFYSLIIEEHTKFYIDGYRESEDSKQREMYDFIYNKLKGKGYKRYEISNFSLDGYNSKHNKVYWYDEMYYAIGVSASGYIDNVRYTNTKSLTKYLEGINQREEEIITEEDNIIEYIMLNLRLDEGIDLIKFNEKFHFDFLGKYKEKIKKLTSLNLLTYNNNRIFASYDGSLILHQIIEEFM